MADRSEGRNQQQIDRSPVRVLEEFPAAAQMTFDRILAERAINESARVIPGRTVQDWVHRLISVGESLDLRVRSFDCLWGEALDFVQQGIPVAFCEEGQDAHEWIVLLATKGRRIRCSSTGREEGGIWIKGSKIRKMLGFKNRGTRRLCVIGQAALGCQAPPTAIVDDGSKASPKPLARLIGLLRPEKRDIWTVLIFSLVVGFLALATPVAVEALVNTVAFGRYLQPVFVLAGLLFTFLAFRAAMRAMLAFIVEIFQRRLFVRVVEDFAYRFPRVRQEQLDGKHGPELANRFFDVVTLQKASASLLLDGTAIAIQTIVGMIVLGFYHPFLLGFDVVLLLLIGFTVFVLGRGAVKSAIKESKAKYAIAAWLEELTRHDTAFKLHSGNPFALDRADQLAATWVDARRTHFRIVMRQILFALTLQAIAGTALLGIGGWLVITGELTLGQLVAAELIVMVIVGSFAKLGKHAESFYDLLAAVDKLGVLFDLQTEDSDRLFHVGTGEAATIRCLGVAYKHGARNVLSKIDMDLGRREVVALTGPSGAGKSTLIELLSGLRAPVSGRIELDGVDIRELRPDSLRDHLAVAGGTQIFQGPIEENVHLNRPNVNANDVRNALKTVGLLDELLDLPDGLHTELQTHGAPLGTTQAAKLMLARAIAGRPRLLLIDGTLDVLPDKELVDVSERVLARDAGYTAIVATGRQAVIDGCDRVLSLSNEQSGFGEQSVAKEK